VERLDKAFLAVDLIVATTARHQTVLVAAVLAPKAVIVMTKTVLAMVELD
jgi:hypothetical protein